VIPVSRGGIDTAATKIALRRVAEGQIVGMFPEGRINMSDRLFLPVRPGAAVVAIKSAGVVVPCYIQGAPYRKVAWSPLFMPARVRVKFGEPIDSAPYAARIAQGETESEVANELLLRTLRVMAELAGQPAFPVELAGRVWKPSEAELAAAMEEADRREQRR
jgi:1-acyl-sn-glycerol-3-phosphate acyltransferase